jgi:hypothetical protein
MKAFDQEPFWTKSYERVEGMGAELGWWVLCDHRCGARRNSCRDKAGLQERTAVEFYCLDCLSPWGRTRLQDATGRGCQRRGFL